MTDPRIAVLSALSSPGWHPVPEAHGMPWDEAEQLLAAYDASRAAAVPSAPADRAAILREAADTVDAMNEGCSRRQPCGACDAREDAADSLRRMAVEAQQPETQAFVCKCPAVLPATTDRADVLREPVNPCTRGNNFCGQHGYDCPPDEPAAGLPAPADRAAGPAALREAAAFYESVLHQSLDPDSDPRYCTAVRDVVMGLRHRADAAQQPTSDRCPHGCNVSTCPCLACEADQPAAVSQPDKEEA